MTNILGPLGKKESKQWSQERTVSVIKTQAGICALLHRHSAPTNPQPREESSRDLTPAIILPTVSDLLPLLPTGGIRLDITGRPANLCCVAGPQVPMHRAVWKGAESGRDSSLGRFSLAAVVLQSQKDEGRIEQRKRNERFRHCPLRL